MCSTHGNTLTSDQASILQRSVNKQNVMVNVLFVEASQR